MLDENEETRSSLRKAIWGYLTAGSTDVFHVHHLKSYLLTNYGDAGYSDFQKAITSILNQLKHMDIIENPSHGCYRLTNKGEVIGKIPMKDWQDVLDLGKLDVAELALLTTKNPPKRNPLWQRDELILALDLYFKHPISSIGPNHADVIELSELLNALPIHQDRPDPGKFRNPNGVYMKLGNFARLDPAYQGKGLDAGSKLDEAVWNEFSGDRQQLSEVAMAIRSAVAGLTAEPTVTIPVEDEEEFPEGKISYRLHRQRERDLQVVRLAKKQRLDQSAGLACEACGFDFNAVYGAVGEGYIEAHHARPVSEMKPGEVTKPSDLVLVCSNCHRMLHRRRPWLSIGSLAEVLQHSHLPN